MFPQKRYQSGLVVSWGEHWENRRIQNHTTELELELHSFPVSLCQGWLFSHQCWYPEDPAQLWPRHVLKLPDFQYIRPIRWLPHIGRLKALNAKPTLWCGPGILLTYNNNIVHSFLINDHMLMPFSQHTVLKLKTRVVANVSGSSYSGRQHSNGLTAEEFSLCNWWLYCPPIGEISFLYDWKLQSILCRPRHW